MVVIGQTIQVQTCQPYPCKPYTGGRVKGLFIGINYRGSTAELRGCVNDVRTILATLQRIDFPLGEACILVDDPSFPGFGGMPTNENILRALRWLSEGARPGDTLFLHYSGHGSQTRSISGNEDDGMDETLVPLDYESAGQIIDDEIYNIVARPLPAGVRLTAIMDCCHSGTLMDLPWVFTASDAIYNAGFNQQAPAFKRSNKNACAADICMFSGCSDEQTSADAVGAKFTIPGNHPGSAGGACTGALAECLTTTQGLTFVQILEGMRGSLKKRGFKQFPQLSCSSPIDLTQPFSLFGPMRGAAAGGAAPAPMPPPQQPAGYPPQQPPPGGAPYPAPYQVQGQPMPGARPGPQMGPSGYPAQMAPGGSPPPTGYPPASVAPGGYPPPSAPGYPPAGAGFPPPSGSGYPPAGPTGYPPPSAPGYPPAGAGYPPAGAGYPAAGAGYPPSGYPPSGPGYPPSGPAGYPPPSGPGYAPAGAGYPPPAGPGYPPGGAGYPPSSYPPPSGPGYPPAGAGYPPPAGPGYPPAGAGYPPAGGPGYPPAGGPGYPPAGPGYAYPTQGGDAMLAQYAGYHNPQYRPY